MKEITKEMREKAFTALVMSHRQKEQQKEKAAGRFNYVAGNAPFKNEGLMGLFFKRAQQPAGLPLAELELVCQEARIARVSLLKRKLSKCVHRDWIWDFRQENDTYYISNVRREELR